MGKVRREREKKILHGNRSGVTENIIFLLKCLVRNHTPLSHSYFRCTKCMNKYASAEALEHHLRTSSHHYPCKQCGKVFTSERLLRRHLHVHGTVNPFMCAVSYVQSFTFACLQQLLAQIMCKKEMYIIKKINIVSLKGLDLSSVMYLYFQQCSKEFKSEYSLKLHQLIHTGEKPFECHICKTAFNRRDKLKRHMLIHEAKKLKCPFRSTLGCLREFSRPGVFLFPWVFFLFLQLCI